MATIITNGCFDLLHAGHRRFLHTAKNLGLGNRLIVAVNSDASARQLKLVKWGERYPIDDLETRMAKLQEYADEVWSFDTEQQLEELIAEYVPCVICKGPDYAGRRVTGDYIAPVIILDTPEPEAVKKLKVTVYGGIREKAQHV